MRRKCSRYHSETKNASKNEPHFQGPKNVDMLQFHANNNVLVTFFFLPIVIAQILENFSNCNVAKSWEFPRFSVVHNRCFSYEVMHPHARKTVRRGVFVTPVFDSTQRSILKFWLAHLSPSWIGADVSLSSAGACGFRSLSSCGGSHCGECYRWGYRFVVSWPLGQFSQTQPVQVVSFLRSPLMRMPPNCKFISLVWFNEQLQLVGMIVCLWCIDTLCFVGQLKMCFLTFALW